MHAIAGSRPHITNLVWNLFRSRVLRGVPQLFVRIGEWRQRKRQRYSLARLDDRLLADIGLSREQQSRECSAAFSDLVAASNPHDTKLYRSLPNLHDR
jgi:uncharacterized protein YjiS (DUF1127 family)